MDKAVLASGRTVLKRIKLSVEAFDDFGWRAPENHFFTTHLSALPLAAQEIGAVATDFPVYFGQKGDNWQAFTHLNPKGDPSSRWLDEDGHLNAKALPFLVNIYPFTAQSIKGNWVLSVWQDSQCVGGSGKPFFEDGMPSRTVAALTRRFSEFVRGLGVAGNLVQKLAAAEVLERVDQKGGDGWKVWQVNELRLAALDTVSLVDLHKSGALALAYTQVVSQVHMKAPSAKSKKQVKYLNKVSNDSFLGAVLSDINDENSGNVGVLGE